MIPVITIDGPGGTGKGSLSLRLKRTLGWFMLDSGALYRALAFSVSEMFLVKMRKDSSK